MLKKLDPFDKRPAYKQLADILIKRFGKLKDFSSPLPSESQLGREYRVGRMVVQKALWELEEKGLIVRYQGKGTFLHSAVSREHKRVSLRIAIWEDNHVSKILPALIEDYRNRTPETDIEIINYQRDTILELDSILEDSTLIPDIVMTTENTFPRMERCKLFCELDALVKPRSRFFKNYVREAFALFESSNKLWAVPIMFSPLCIFANDNILRKRHEFKSWEEILEKKSSRQLVWSLLPSLWALIFLYYEVPLIEYENVNYFDVFSPRFEKAINFFEQTFARENILTLPELHYDLIIDAFTEGKYPLLVYGLYDFGRISAKAEFDVKLYPIPGKKVSNLLFASGMGICRRSSKRHEAMDFIEYLISAPAQRIVRRESVALSVKKDILQEQAPYREFFNRQEFVRFDFDRDEDWIKVIKRVLHKLLYRLVNAKEAVKEIREQSKFLIRQ